MEEIDVGVSLKASLENQGVFYRKHLLQIASNIELEAFEDRTPAEIAQIIVYYYGFKITPIIETYPKLAVDNIDKITSGVETKDAYYVIHYSDAPKVECRSLSLLDLSKMNKYFLELQNEWKRDFNSKVLPKIEAVVKKRIQSLQSQT